MKDFSTLPRRAGGWNNSSMATSTVDSKKRIAIPGAQPGEIFDIQRLSEGEFMLVRIDTRNRATRMSKKACMEAMRKNPLEPQMSWEKLRELTREA